jgi:hypothetical protein
MTSNNKGIKIIFCHSLELNWKYADLTGHSCSDFCGLHLHIWKKTVMAASLVFLPSVIFGLPYMFFSV